MLTQEEKDFIVYWEANRLKQKKLGRQWLIGLPIGLLFSIPILINYATPWHKRANMVAGSSFNPLVLIFAVLLIISFVAIFHNKLKWEKHEQKYLELKAKEKQ
ncbi:hypothetical protein OI18_11870 [Flavihumibacter solisilvae]|jgi:hypothetical protein|uniref:Uncharacterized protein n=2 Tax=Flavihumibacter solisilvae TaxID=1349421 RepID=A0A0C1IVC7_9BACT|nr:hypothetical protein OI18_11870 [Flavihumibacter solisilvae]